MPWLQKYFPLRSDFLEINEHNKIFSLTFEQKPVIIISKAFVLRYINEARWR